MAGTARRLDVTLLLEHQKDIDFLKQFLRPEISSKLNDEGVIQIALASFARIVRLAVVNECHNAEEALATAGFNEEVKMFRQIRQQKPQ